MLSGVEVVGQCIFYSAQMVFPLVNKRKTKVKTFLCVTEPSRPCMCCDKSLYIGIALLYLSLVRNKRYISFSYFYTEFYVDWFVADVSSNLQINSSQCMILYKVLEPGWVCNCLRGSFCPRSVSIYSWRYLRLPTITIVLSGLELLHTFEVDHFHFTPFNTYVIMNSVLRGMPTVYLATHSQMLLSNVT